MSIAKAQLIAKSAAALSLLFVSSGCVATALGAGAVAADEIAEGDGRFDPLEEAYDGDPGTTPIIDEDD